MLKTKTLAFLFSALLLSPLLGKAESTNITEIFNQLKKRATQQSYEIQMAQEQLNQSSSKVYTNWTHWIPHLDFQMAQTRSKDYSFLSSGALGNLPFNFTPEAVSVSRWELDLTAPLFRRSVLLGIETSNAENDLNQTKLNSKIAELDWRMHSHLGNFLFQFYKELTLKTSFEIATQNLKEAQLRFNLGQKTKVDVLRAEANLTSIQAKRYSIQQDKENSLNQFLEYTGLTPSEFSSVGIEKLTTDEAKTQEIIDQFSDISAYYSQIKDISGQKLDEQVSSSSPTYKTLMSESEMNDLQSQSLMSQEWPELVFKGTINQQGNNWSEAFSANRTSYSASIALSIPLFSGGSLLSTYHEKFHAQKANQIKHEKDILNFLNQVKMEKVQIQTLLSTLESQKLILSQNEEILRLSFKSYQLGKATTLELLNSQDALIDAKLNLAKTKLDLAALTRQFAYHLGVTAP